MRLAGHLPQQQRPPPAGRPGAAAAGVFSFAEVYGGRTAVMSWAA
jgi:hypothetical protein